jgi:hypothetical protein
MILGWVSAYVLAGVGYWLLVKTTFYPDSLRVNNPKNDDALCIEPQLP